MEKGLIGKGEGREGSSQVAKTRERERKRERGDRQTEPASARVELCI